MQHEAIIRQLFETQALQISDPDTPFWYTSGKFGPYFINTHFLYENADKAKEVLVLIESTLDYPLGLAHTLGSVFTKQYLKSPHYRRVIDELAALTEGLSFDYVSGGARRDFFFSYALSAVLQKEHLCILKNGSVFHSDVGFKKSHEVKENELQGAKILHVADLVTIASSYFRAWLPAIQSCGGTVDYSLAVVDRNQGGADNLADAGIELRTLVTMGSDFFRKARDLGQITERQEAQLNAFLEDPDRYMYRFIADHPDFLEKSAAKDAKTAERVERFRRNFAEA